MTPAPDAVGDVFRPTATQRVRWNQLQSPDLARAKAFYAKHLGFRFDEAMYSLSERARSGPPGGGRRRTRHCPIEADQTSWRANRHAPPPGPRDRVGASSPSSHMESIMNEPWIEWGVLRDGGGNGYDAVLVMTSS